jgi:hypothetical protein
MPGQSLFPKPKDPQGESAVDRFLASQGVGSGRLIFALDATASRGPTWDLARRLTGDMIREASGVSLQLAYFRGGLGSPAECVASTWSADAVRLTQLMAKVECRAGYTQIARVLAHAERETLAAKVGALVLIGDMCDPQGGDNLDTLAAPALALRRLKTPIFCVPGGKAIWSNLERNFDARPDERRAEVA